MIERQQGGLDANKPSRIMALAVTFAAVVALYFVVRTAATTLSPGAAAALPPADASGLFKGLLYAASDPRRRVTPEVVALSRRAALSSPLAYEPFFIQARAEEQAGRLENAIRLMEEARRRRSSFILTRIQLVAYYQQARRYPELLAEIDYVLRKSEQAKQFILPELVKLMTDHQGRVALAAMLGRNPAWRSDFFDVARQQPGTAADALALLDLARSRGRGPNIALERSLYLHRLVESGDYAGARSIWLESIPQEERARNALLFNGDFRPVSADRPFAWTFHQEPQGRAERVTAGTSTPYLDIVYYGGSNAILAEQVLALPPGRYRLSQLARSDEDIRSGRIFWSLSCIADDREVGRLPAAGLGREYRPSRSDFIVPAGCSGQRLRLLAEPGDIAAELHIQLMRLELARAD